MKAKISNAFLTVETDTLGGALSSIRDDKEVEYLWQADPAYWANQAPTCFPMCGSLRNDEATIGGDLKTAMPRHGLAKKAEFEQGAVTEDSVTYILVPNESMKAAYPYQFRLEITYRLSGKTVSTIYRVTNEDSRPMPFCIGGHPAFNCPIGEDESYEDYVIEFEKKETITVPTPVTETGLIDVEHRTPFLNNENRVQLSHEMFAVDATIFDELQSRKATLLHKTKKRGVEVSFPDFPYLVLWSTTNGAPFVAIEPWAGLSTCSDESDVFEEKRNVTVLPAGETKTFQFDITIL